MVNQTLLPIEQNFETQLSQELGSGAGDLTIHAQAVPTATIPASYKFIATVEPKSAREENILVESKDAALLTLTASTGGRAQALGNGKAGTRYAHPVGSKVIISDAYPVYADTKTAIESKANTASPVFTGGMQVPSFADAAARDLAITVPTNGMEAYLISEGYFTDYTGGSWVVRASGGTFPNASTTVAGKVEEATAAEVGAGTGVGGTGARLFINPTSTAKTSSGAGDENKLPVISATGQLAAGFIPTGTDSTKIAKSFLDAKGDLISASANDTPVIVSAGADGTLVGYDSSQASGLIATRRNRRLATSLTPITVGNTAVETAILSASIPAGLLGTANGIRGRIYISDYDQTTVRNLDLKLKYGATTLGTINITAPASNVTNWRGILDFEMFNNANAAVQVGGTSLALSISSAQLDLAGKPAYSREVDLAAAENSASALTFQVTATWDGAATGATLTAALGYIETIEA